MQPGRSGLLAVLIIRIRSKEYEDYHGIAGRLWSPWLHSCLTGRHIVTELDGDCTLYVRCTVVETALIFVRRVNMIGGHNPPDITPWFRTQGVMSGGLRPPILKFSFQVGDVWFCEFYPALPLNGGFRPRGVTSELRPRGLCPVSCDRRLTRASALTRGVHTP